MKAKRVVVVVWAGGVRAQDTILDSRHRYVPRIWSDLVARGTLLTRLYNDGWTNHGPSLKALATGRWEVDGYDYPRPKARTVVDAARESGRSTLVIGKSRLDLLASDDDASHAWRVSLSRDPAPFAPEEPAAAIYALKSYDRSITATFLARNAQGPELSFLLFDDTDMAHQGRWSRYAGAIRQADALVFLLWQRLGADTDLIVLPAHGRGDHGQTRWGFMGHGRDDEGCTRLWMLGLGPDFGAGRVLEKRAQLIDVAPTIARLLGLDFPCRGRALEGFLS